jgi:hypothetical protein
MFKPFSALALLATCVSAADRIDVEWYGAVW